MSRTLPLLLLWALACGDRVEWTAEVDADRDGFLVDEDCDDGDPTVHPDAPETCNGWDDNCDGRVDEDGAAGGFLAYQDNDGDGYGKGSASLLVCELPLGYAVLAGDCNDGDPGTRPGATEVCDGDDEDCDGNIDEATASGAPEWWRDADGDLYGHPDDSLHACAAPIGYVGNPEDCNDGDATVNPKADEICGSDGVDEDCNAWADDEDPACGGDTGSGR